MAKDIILSTTQEIPGRGSGKDPWDSQRKLHTLERRRRAYSASLESLLGGEITAYLEKRMKIESSEVMQNAAEILAYGTTIKLRS